jgi:hypothetical protein
MIFLSKQAKFKTIHGVARAAALDRLARHLETELVNKSRGTKVL